MASETYPDGFGFSKKTRRYRDLRTGKFIKDDTIRQLRDDFIVSQRGFVEDLASALADGSITLQKWEAELWDRIKLTYEAEFLAGRGGRNVFTELDRTTIGRMLKDQRVFLRGFADAIKSGTMTESKIAARSKLYINSATQSFERGRSQAWDMILPAYPGDGTTICLSNCKCHWEISERVDRKLAYWKLASSEHCTDCVDRGVRWSPYTVMNS